MITNRAAGITMGIFGLTVYFGAMVFILGGLAWVNFVDARTEISDEA
jgi:hypothetical protein